MIGWVILAHPKAHEQGERMNVHTQVPVVLDGQEVGIDDRLVPLIKALWSLGIRTTNSCQGTDEEWRSGFIAIDGRDFGRFLDLFEDDLEIALQARARKLNIHDGCQRCLSGWHSGLRESFDTAAYHDGEQFVLGVALRFPPSFVEPFTAAALARTAHARVRSEKRSG